MASEKIIQRRKLIVDMLGAAELSLGQMCLSLDAARTTIAKDLEILRDEGLIYISGHEKMGSMWMVLYRAGDEEDAPAPKELLVLRERFVHMREALKAPKPVQRVQRHWMDVALFGAAP